MTVTPCWACLNRKLASPRFLGKNKARQSSLVAMKERGVCCGVWLCFFWCFRFDERPLLQRVARGTGQPRHLPATSAQACRRSLRVRRADGLCPSSDCLGAGASYRSRCFTQFYPRAGYSHEGPSLALAFYERCSRANLRLDRPRVGVGRSSRCQTRPHARPRDV
jgi:hypothetical protein